MLTWSGNRYCTLEDFQAGQPNCTENEVNGAYREVYYPEARSGYTFSAWGNYCAEPNQLDLCGFNISKELVEHFSVEEVPPLVAYFRKEVTKSHKAVLMGHSFFHPFFGPLRDDAKTVGFTSHTQTEFKGDGPEGAPISFWRNVNSASGIRSALDAGGITLLGMTYYPLPDEEDNLQGIRNWIEYALKKNSGFAVFIGMPWGTNPGSTDLIAYREPWNVAHEKLHGFIDTLRKEYPQLDIYCIPYGQAGIQLKELYEQGNLADVDAFTGSWETSIFTDGLGHSGKILVELGSLIWLRAIYGVNLKEYDYQTPYTIDLAALADKILNQHNHYYDAR